MKPAGSDIGHAAADGIADRGVERAVGKGGELGHDPAERKGAGEVADRQRQRQRQPLAAQRGGDVGGVAAGAAAQRRFALAAREQRRKVRLPLEREREERRVRARPLDRACQSGVVMAGGWPLALDPASVRAGE